MEFYDDNDYAHGMSLLIDEPKTDLKQLNDYKRKMDSLVYTYPMRREDAKEGTGIRLLNLKFRKFHKLLTSASEPLLGYNTNISMLLANRSDFRAPKKFNAEFRKAFDKRKETIRVLCINSNGKTKHYPIFKDRDDNTREINEIRLIKGQNIRNFKVIEDEDKENEIKETSMIEDFYATHEDFAED